MTNNLQDDKIKIFFQKNDVLQEFDMPIDKLELEIKRFVKKILAAIETSQIEELQVDAVITSNGELALVSGFDIKTSAITVQLKIRRDRSDLKINVRRAKEEKLRRDTLLKAALEANSPEELMGLPSIDSLLNSMQKDKGITNTSREKSEPSSWSNKIIPATGKTPALIILLIDASGSMSEPYENGESRIDTASALIYKIAVRLVQRSTKGTVVVPRYHVAMYAYSSQVIDLYNGIKTIDELAKMGVPKLTTLDTSDPATAFTTVEAMLLDFLPNYQNCPTPMIFHISDGEFNGADPLPIIERIFAMGVLVVNVFAVDLDKIFVDSKSETSDNFPAEGIFNRDELTPYGQWLYDISSFIPNSCQSILHEFNIKLSSQAKMMFPINQGEIITLLPPMSGATPVTFLKS